MRLPAGHGHGPEKVEDRRRPFPELALARRVVIEVLRDEAVFEPVEDQGQRLHDHYSAWPIA
jgi:hypothetical protein